MNLKDRLKYKPISTKPRKFFMLDANQNKESWVHRLLDERVWLGNKVDALRLFLGSHEAEELDEREASLLQQQFYYMENYLWVLQKRIRSAGLQT